MNQLAHDLFLLMLNLSQLTNQERILTVFLDVMNSLHDKVYLRLLTEDESSPSNTVDITTAQRTFGRIAIEGDLSVLPADFLALVRNAICLLALVLENRAQERLLADKNLQLKVAIKERTLELTRAIKELEREISERKQAEKAWRKSEEKYRRHFENVTEIIYSIDTELKILSMSPSVERVLGYKADELIGRFFQELNILAPDCLAAAFSDTKRVLAGERISASVYKFVAKDGTEKFGEVSGAPLILDGEVVGLVSVARDITERILAEQERARLLAQIQKQAQQVQQIVDVMPEGVLLLDADLNILSANPAARKSLAALIGTEIGAPLTHLGPLPLADVLQRHADTLPVEITLSEPSRRIFETKARPIGEGGAHLDGGRQWVLTLREVTQEREQQRQMQTQERLATVGQLAAGIAHDFNNIMAGIVLYSGMMLRSSELSPKDQKRLNTIRQQGHRAANLVDQILDFARRSIMERRPLDLVPFLKELEQLLARILPENIHIYLDYEHEEYVANADPTRIQQVVMNLALNARDAMPDGGELRFALSRFQLQPGQLPPIHDMSPGEWIRVLVSDSGSGIPPEVLDHVFEPFFTTKEVGKGTGLGLAQVYGIVRQHEGYIGVQTSCAQVDHGTTFNIYLPALMLPGIAEEMLEMNALAQGRGETVLVVEDDPAAREAIAEILTDLGYRVLTAANGREALEIFGDDVALVLSDLVMPQMGGDALYAVLKAQHPQLKMVVITGYPLADGGKALLEQGITAWIKKPFSADEIARVVREVLA